MKIQRSTKRSKKRSKTSATEAHSNRQRLRPKGDWIEEGGATMLASRERQRLSRTFNLLKSEAGGME